MDDPQTCGQLLAHPLVALPRHSRVLVVRNLQDAGIHQLARDLLRVAADTVIHDGNSCLAHYGLPVRAQGGGNNYPVAGFGNRIVDGSS